MVEQAISRLRFYKKLITKLLDSILIVPVTDYYALPVIIIYGSVNHNLYF